MKARQAQFRHNLVLSKVIPAVAVLFAHLSAATSHADSSSICERAEAAFRTARAAWNTSSDNVTNAWQFGRAAFDRAECAADDHERAAIAEEGILACRAAAVRAPQSAPAHYYLAQNLGQLARTKSLGALKLVREMEKLWLRARDLDAAFDHAGPDRSLGLLYRDAPGWPVSIGSNARSRSHLEQAVKLAPDFPDNRLCLAEALAHWDQRDELAAQLKALDELWPRAKAKFTGPGWEQSWADWEPRLAALKHGVKPRPRAE